MSMKFIREIPEAKIVQREINDLEQYGYTLVYMEDSIIVYAEVADSQYIFEELKQAA